MMDGNNGDQKRGATALIAVDVQADFLPGGPMGVQNGDEVVDALVEAARGADFVFASRDWHPVHHCSFAERGGPWPPHCIAGTDGAHVHPRIERIADYFPLKGNDLDVDAYSAFEAHGDDLAELLRSLGVDRVLVGGLATDYCVKATVLDAVKAGFDVEVLKDASRAVNVNPGDEQAALDEMELAGAEIVGA